MEIFKMLKEKWLYLYLSLQWYKNPGVEKLFYESLN